MRASVRWPIPAAAGTSIVPCLGVVGALIQGSCLHSKASVSPPQKGSFPLDHFYECKTLMDKYMACMKKEAWTHASCREETKACVQHPTRFLPENVHAVILLLEEQRSLQSSTASRCFPLCHLLCHRDPLEYSHPCCLLSRNSWSPQSRYLQCRMNKGLMTPEDMSKFGLNDQVHRPSSLCNPALDVAAFKFVFYFLTCMHFSMCRSILRLV